ncbi:MAG: type II toxin-antitoxin system RelE/ParE family toxin [Synergistaceae bacterium]|nr:type II toxin-antitoxin system RelE/ParE family toxin [Synergistaceae bacterium]MBQ3449989.1 type II toxin-antitoxin system RelE/ParE family toxin [Synergistaceae bacterium]MBQ3693583.1 type II toxin-antitoxin system RelE/ParE family toxin [Synergistaceae bacterium]
MWTVNVDKSVDKKLKKIPNQDKARIQQVIDDLEVKPEQLDIKPLVGREGYRLKVGGWRLLMDINEDERVIFIYTLASRGDVYKK